MTSGITREAWLKALTDAGLHDDEDDQSAVTVMEFAEMFGLARHTAEHRLDQLEKVGAAVRTRKRGTASDGRTISYLAFRLVRDAETGA